jgi:putative transposase
MSVEYPSNLTDGQWQMIRPLLPKASRRGRPPTGQRLILNAIQYLVRTGCQWRQLPRAVPNCKTVDNTFRRWRCEGVWRRVHDVVRGRVRRAALGRGHRQPVGAGGESRGYDAGKKVSGRKRRLAVDTLGLIWSEVVCGADWQDHDAAPVVIHQLRHLGRRLKGIFGDSAYGRGGLPEWVKATFGWALQTVLRPARTAGFVVLPKRWVVERTFAWLSRDRRLARDHQRLEKTLAGWHWLALISLQFGKLIFLSV